MNIKLSRTGRRLSVLIGILTTMIASGCATPDAAVTRAVADYTVTIKFDADGCPISVTPPSQLSCSLAANGLCVNPGKAVQWVSSPETPFQVYFDPFVGRPYSSHRPDHTTNAIVVKDTSLAGEYEYSVVGTDCVDVSKAVLDPPIRVEF